MATDPMLYRAVTGKVCVTLGCNIFMEIFESTGKPQRLGNTPSNFQAIISSVGLYSYGLGVIWVYWRRIVIHCCM